jgi:hypothetical protein
MLSHRVILSIALLAAGCRQGMPVYDPSEKPPTVDGTVSGRVMSATGAPLSSLKVDLIEVRTGATHSVSSDVNGAFTVKVPPGRYRMQVELRSGERLDKPIGEIDINKSDVDANIEVVIR